MIGPADNRGFTLVEVIVALGIIALALPVLLTSLYNQADDTAYLRDQTLAQMVAANKLTEVRLGVEAESTIGASKERGSSRLAERDWYWSVDITAAPGVQNFYRIDISVSGEEDENAAPLYTLAGFMSGDLATDESGFGAGGDGLPDGSDLDDEDIGDLLDDVEDSGIDPSELDGLQDVINGAR